MLLKTAGTLELKVWGEVFFMGVDILRAGRGESLIFGEVELSLHSKVRRI